MVAASGAELCTQAFGDPGSPPILLVMGQMASMLWWPDGFCQKLAALKYYVIRYDNRDTGRSTIYEPGEPPYTMDDMAADAVRVLDGYGIDRVNLIGMSLGGTIAQIAALSYPERVKTLTLMSTTPIGIDTSGLPHTTDAYMAHAATGDAIDWTDNAQVIEFLVRDTRMIAGVAHTYDEGRARAFVERDVRRAKNFVSATNHFMLRGGQALKGKLAELAASLLVIHGTADPIYPVEHGELLARTVRGAKLVRLEGGGHEIHPNDWEEIIFAIDAHLR